MAGIRRSKGWGAGRAAASAGTAGGGAHFLEAGIGSAVEFSRDVGELFGQAIIKCSIGKIWRDASATVAFVEVARAFHEFVIGGETAIKRTARTALSDAGS